MENYQIGNIVARGYMNQTQTGFKKEYEPCEIKALGIEKIIVNSKINSNELIKMDYENIKPVLLDKNWFNKLGFFIIETNGTIEASMLNFRYTIQTVNHYDGFFFCDGNDVLTNFNYIHQLQNLMFCLGNIKLSIK